MADFWDQFDPARIGTEPKVRRKVKVEATPDEAAQVIDAAQPFRVAANLAFDEKVISRPTYIKLCTAADVMEDAGMKMYAKQKATAEKELERAERKDGMGRRNTVKRSWRR